MVVLVPISVHIAFKGMWNKRASRPDFRVGREKQRILEMGLTGKGNLFLAQYQSSLTSAKDWG